MKTALILSAMAMAIVGPGIGATIETSAGHDWGPLEIETGAFSSALEPQSDSTWSFDPVGSAGLTFEFMNITKAETPSLIFLVETQETFEILPSGDMVFLEPEPVFLAGDSDPPTFPDNVIFDSSPPTVLLCALGILPFVMRRQR